MSLVEPALSPLVTAEQVAPPAGVLVTGTAVRGPSHDAAHVHGTSCYWDFRQCSWVCGEQVCDNRAG
jgi:hypothetical protein